MEERRDKGREGRRVRGGEECLEEMEKRGEGRRKEEEMQWRRRMKGKGGGCCSPVTIKEGEGTAEGGGGDAEGHCSSYHLTPSILHSETHKSTS